MWPHKNSNITMVYDTYNYGLWYYGFIPHCTMVYDTDNYGLWCLQVHYSWAL